MIDFSSCENAKLFSKLELIYDAFDQQRVAVFVLFVIEGNGGSLKYAHIYLSKVILRCVMRKSVTAVASGTYVLATSFLNVSLANCWHFFPKKDEQPGLTDCCSHGQLVFKFFHAL